MPNELLPILNGAKVWREGLDYKTDYDFNFIPSQITGNACYVDITPGGVGSNSNPGTESLPFLTMTYAIGQNFNIYYVRGIGNRTTSIFNGGTKNFKVLRWGDTNPELINANSITWTVNGTYSNVYDGATANTISSVFDKSTTNVNTGKYLGYTYQTSIANVAANAGSWYYSSNVVYVHPFNERVADDSIIACVDAITVTLTSAITSNNVAYNYLENLDIYGGSNVVCMNNTAGGRRIVGFNTCNFGHAGVGQQASIWCQNRTIGYYKDCTNYSNGDDAFDYNGTDNGILEWKCKSGYSVTTSEGSINGSTSHGSSRVIRVAPDVRSTDGKGIQDINATISYTLGGFSGYMNTASAANRYGYAGNSSTGTTNIWLIECKAVDLDGNKGFQNFSGTVMNIYDGEIGDLLTKNNLTAAGTTNYLVEADIFQ